MSSGWTPNDVNTELKPPMNISTMFGMKTFVASWAPANPMVNGTIDNTTVWCLSNAG